MSWRPDPVVCTIMAQPDNDRPAPPTSDLRDALNDHPEALQSAQALHDEWHGDKPDPDSLHRHVGFLSSIPAAEAIVANWWDDPRTQQFVKSLTDAGL